MAEPSYYVIRVANSGADQTVTPALLRDLAASGRLRPHDLVGAPNLPWRPAHQIPGLFPPQGGAPRTAQPPMARPAPSFQPADAASAEELLGRILVPGEEVRAVIAGLKKFHDFFEWIPFIRLLFQMQRQPFVAALTGRRLVLIRLKKTFGGVRPKEWIAYELADVAAVACQTHLLTATVTIHAADGTRHQLRDVNKEAGPAFAALFAAQRQQASARS